MLLSTIGREDASTGNEKEEDRTFIVQIEVEMRDMWEEILIDRIFPCRGGIGREGGGARIDGCAGGRTEVYHSSGSCGFMHMSL